MIQKILDEAHNLKIAVIGDFIEDRYIIGDVNRISPEAPVPVVSVSNQKSSIGGAGNVFMNLRGLNVDAYMFCDLNNPTFELPLKRWMYERRKHCVKTRIMSGSHHIVRLDEDVIPIVRFYKDMKWRDAFEAMLVDLDCVVISDYHKGVVSDDVAQSIIRLCVSRKIPVVVDAKRDYHKFTGATVVKCNGKEWADQAFRSTTEFIQKRNIDALVITHGERGMEMTDRGNNSIPFDYQIARLYELPIVDVCGAGDTVTAILAIGEALMHPRSETIQAANRIAGEVCRHPGVYPIQRSDIERMIKE